MLVLDNGGYEIRYREGGNVPNCIAKPKGHVIQNILGHEISLIKEPSLYNYHSPMERGYVVNWNHQELIWNYIMEKECKHKKDIDFVTTVPPFMVDSMKNEMEEIVFEGYNVKSFLPVNACEMAIVQNPVLKNTSTCLVVDTGYSHTHCVPMYNGQRIHEGIVRINVGGKLLTNYLKQIVSVRQWNMMEDTKLINEVKEALCYCSLDFMHEMKNCSKNSQAVNVKRNCSIRRDWVLPDFQNHMTGFVKNYQLDEVEDATVVIPGMPAKPQEQILSMGVERISIPELLFRPSDIGSEYRVRLRGNFELGLKQAGIAESIGNSIAKCPLELQGLLYNNIILIGGNAKFSNFVQRLENELRVIAPVEYAVRVQLAEDPQLAAWQGASKFVHTTQYQQQKVSRQAYLEHGHRICTQNLRY